MDNFIKQGTPYGTVGKESTCKARAVGGMGLIPELERCPGEGNANPLQYSCLGNPKDRGAWRAQLSRTQLSDVLNNYSISHDLIKKI